MEIKPIPVINYQITPSTESQEHQNRRDRENSGQPDHKKQSSETVQSSAGSTELSPPAPSNELSRQIIDTEKMIELMGSQPSEQANAAASFRAKIVDKKSPPVMPALDKKF